MAAAGQTLNPTLSFLDDAANQTHDSWSEHLAQSGSVQRRSGNEDPRAAMEAGVAIAMGFDSKPESCAAAELQRMVDAGMTASDALIAATAAGAAAIGLDHLIGTIEPGKLADLPVVEGNPLTAVGILTTPESLHIVLRSGHIAPAEDR